MRVLTPHTPIMALSATLSPNVLAYAQSALRMNKPTGLIKRSIDRPNIYLVCLPIEHPIALRRDLEYLVPLQMLEGEVRAIPKTVLFMDSRALVCSTTTALITRLPPQLRNADIVCDYSTALSEARRRDIMEKFLGGDCRILVCTEAAGMGVDVPDVSRVIQWTVSRQLNISNFWQRAGRCGRNRNLPGVAVLFYNKTQRISNVTSSDDVLSLYCEPAYGLRSQLALEHIRGIEHGDSALAVASNQTTGNTQLEPGANTQLAQENSLSDYENREPQVHQPNITTQAGSLPSAPSSAQLSSTLKYIDKGLLWFLSTVGCRRALIRQYFDDTHVSPFQDIVQPDVDAPVMHTLPTSPCCDNCSNLNNLSLSAGMISLLPPSNISELEEPTITENIERINPTRARPNRTISRILRKTLKANLEKLRIDIWAQEGLNQRGGFFGPELILQDKVITTLVQKARSIYDIESLKKTLERDNVNLQFAIVGPHAQKLLEVILSTLIEPPMEGENCAPGAADSQIPNGNSAELQTPLATPLARHGLSRMVRTRGRPPAALRTEQAQLEAEIARVAQHRMAEAATKGEDGTRYDLSLLGKRPRGRPTADMQEARRLAGEAKDEIMESLLTEAAFPLLWARKSSTSAQLS